MGRRKGGGGIPPDVCARGERERERGGGGGGQSQDALLSCSRSHELKEPRTRVHTTGTHTHASNPPTKTHTRARQQHQQQKEVGFVAPIIDGPSLSPASHTPRARMRKRDAWDQALQRVHTLRSLASWLAPRRARKAHKAARFKTPGATPEGVSGARSTAASRPPHVAVASGDWRSSRRGCAFVQVVAGRACARLKQEEERGGRGLALLPPSLSLHARVDRAQSKAASRPQVARPNATRSLSAHPHTRKH